MTRHLQRMLLIGVRSFFRGLGQGAAFVVSFWLFVELLKMLAS
jgi:hypothetical protein